MEMAKDLEGKVCEEWLRSLSLFSLEKRRLRGDLIAEWQESCPVEKDLRVVVTEHEAGCAQVAKGILAWISNGVGSRSRAGIVPLCWALLRPHLESGVQFWASSYKDFEVLERVQRRTMELGKGLEHQSCEEQLRELGVFSLDKNRLRDDLMTPYTCLNRGCGQVGSGSFQVTGDRTGAQSLKLHQGTFKSDTRKNFFMEGVVKYWHELPRVITPSSVQEMTCPLVLWFT
ncbi:hypothetical protein HGM15179_013940 [Zosterops borbonicus]|uniref:Uncharacterized protein n=1 Tax=Zosterops borbonicus TaxID=364589 RepID=A0A8K1LGI7_9PASS|nr:hypothetical protein HGM15179_013940 [Zosterops borbonicus]